MPLLKNNAPRLITINVPGDDGEATPYRILPGENPAVDVPAEALELDFVKALIENGSLRQVSDEAAPVVSTEQLELAKVLGIKVDKRWGAERIAEEIAKAQAK